jgi:lysophospholipid hydrolase
MNAFLSSIKVFGYLDKPVFHELAKSLETKILEQGEVLFDVESEDRDFYIVVDGQIELFIKNNGHDDSDYSDDEDNDEFAKHHMLNNVKAGGTVTSLFSILSILSQDMVLPAKLVPTVSDPNGEKMNGDKKKKSPGDVTPSSSKTTHDIPLPFKEGAFEECESSETDSVAHTSASGNTVKSKDLNEELKESDLKSHRKMSMDSKTSSSTRKQKKERRHKSVHPNLVARASKATKLAVIPATAFQKLAEKFPNSAAHMVQVILTRFQRVTFMTLHKYLGLSGELLAIERKLNEISGSGLPVDKFPQDQMESILWRLSHQHNADANLPRSRTSSKKPPKVYQLPSEGSDEDLGFSDIQRNQREFLKDFENGHPFIAGDEDEILKDSVFNCMAQLIGLTPSKEPNVKGPVVRRNSLRSPQITPINTSIERFYYGKNRSLTNSVSKSFYDADDISVVSSSMASSVGDIGQDNLDVPEVELLFYKQGELLLKEGDRSHGLYFVLDGTIEASTSPGKELIKEEWKSSRSPRRKKKDVFLIQPGSLAGYLSAFTGNPSFVTLKAKTDILVGLMPKIVLERYVDKYPNILLCLAKRLVNQLSPLVFHIDVALEWAQINAGQSLCRQGILY